MAKQAQSTGDAGETASVSPRQAVAALAAFNSKQQQQIAEGLKLQFREKIHDEPTVSISLSPAYRHPFGKVMTVRLHGHSLFVPCNGRTYKVPKSYAAIILARRRAFDEQEMRQERMAQVTNNNEQFMGQLQFG